MARILIAFTAAAGLAIATPALAGNSGNAAAGQATFKAKCAICHGVTANAPAGIGPNLYKVIGRKAGTLPGYNYSAAMKASGITWSADTLKTYLANPQGTVRGNKMPFGGMPNAADRDNVAAYIATLR